MHYSSTNKHVRDPVPLVDRSCISNILMLPRVYPLGFSHSRDNSTITKCEIEIIINRRREISITPHAWISFLIDAVSSYI
jgi:hypothetical protein